MNKTFPIGNIDKHEIVRTVGDKAQIIAVDLKSVDVPYLFGNRGIFPFPQYQHIAAAFPASRSHIAAINALVIRECPVVVDPYPEFIGKTVLFVNIVLSQDLNLSRGSGTTGQSCSCKHSKRRSR